MRAHTARATLADPENGALDDVVDIDRYPLDCPESPEYERLITRVREDLTAHGAATLPGFLQPRARDTIATHLAQVEQHVPIRRHVGTVYARRDLEADLAADDPRCAPLEWNADHVTRDMIPVYSEAHRLYVSPHFKQLIAWCVGCERIYEYADPIAGLVATVLPPGGEYPWHYDTNEFVVTIMIRRPEAGGQFEYHADLRRPGDENLDGLARVLDGTDRDAVQVVDNKPGDLQLFLGRYSLHRVTKVAGTVARHVLVLSYSDRPGVIGPLDRTRSVYGRVTEAHLVASEARAAAEDGLIL